MIPPERMRDSFLFDMTICWFLRRTIKDILESSEIVTAEAEGPFRYKNPDNDRRRAPWKSISAQCDKLRSRAAASNLLYINSRLTGNTGTIHRRMERLLACRKSQNSEKDDRLGIQFGRDGNGRPIIKDLCGHDTRRRPPETIWH